MDGWSWGKYQIICVIKVRMKCIFYKTVARPVIAEWVGMLDSGEEKQKQ